MNKEMLHEALDKMLEDIDTWMEDIHYIKTANWDIKTTIEIGIRKTMMKFNEKLKEHVIAEFNKEIGEQNDNSNN